MTMHESEYSKEQMLMQLWSLLGPLESDANDTNGATTNDELQPSDVQHMVLELHGKLFAPPDMIKRRLEVLISPLWPREQMKDPQGVLTLSRLITAILTMPNSLSEKSTISLTILNLYKLVLAKLYAIVGRSTGTAQEDESIERCGICSEHIPFEDWRWAKCAKGHQFRKLATCLMGRSANIVQYAVA